MKDRYGYIAGKVESIHLGEAADFLNDNERCLHDFIVAYGIVGQFAQVKDLVEFIQTTDRPEPIASI